MDEEYTITIREIYTRQIVVEAGCPEDAITKIQLGHGKESSPPKYESTLGSDKWIVTGPFQNIFDAINKKKY